RRSSEFVSNGIKVVCSSRHIPRLQKLQKLSLYDNMLSHVKVGTLETLWVDDNAITDFPRSVLQLK
ncbi:unnamed protein product, partial [Ectocarpus sp. 12 AP-2014]